MALSIDTPPPSPSRSPAGAATRAADLRSYVFALFFVFGGITSLNDVLIPKLKHLFTLGYAEVMMVQSAFFVAYFLVSLPAAALVRRIGYMRTAAAGLVTMTAGCLLFVPASATALFPAFLAALFVLASGITIVQVVANPLISMLGPPESAASRLTFAQAFNALGTTVFPFVGARLILGSLNLDDAGLTGDALRAYRSSETAVIVQTYLGIAAALLVVAAAVWLGRHRLVEPRAPATPMLRAFNLLRQPRFALGAMAIFVYVGAEVSIGSLIASWLMQAETLALSPQRAGEFVAVYWGGAMIGRFVGAGAMRRVAPTQALMIVALAAIALLTTAGLSTGAVAGWSLLLVGFANAIMFPTIFSLATQGLVTRAAEGSGIICMAIVGGAIVPLATGRVADLAGLATALIVPAVCYGFIASFAFACRALAPLTDD